MIERLLFDSILSVILMPIFSKGGLCNGSRNQCTGWSYVMMTAGPELNWYAMFFHNAVDCESPVEKKRCVSVTSVSRKAFVTSLYV